MTPFLAIVRNTLKQLTSRGRVIGFSIVSLLPAGLLLVAGRARQVEGLDTDLGSLLVAPFFAVVLPLTTLILAGSVLADERRDKTLSFLVLRPVSRVSVVGAKTLAAAITTSAFATLAAMVMVGVFWASVGGTTGIDARLLMAILAGSVISCVLYSSLFALLGNLISRPILVGIFYILIIEAALVENLPRLAPASPWRVGLAATIDLMPSSFPARALLPAIGDLAPSAGNALLGTVATAAIAVALGTLLVRRTDSV